MAHDFNKESHKTNELEQSEKKRLEEIEKIDISDWKQKHGYK